MSRFVVLLTLLSLVGCQDNRNDTAQKAAFPVESGKSEAAPAPREIFKAGDTAPKIDLPDLNGNQVTLDSLGGQVTLVNFWATWCVPCVAEMPALERLSQLLYSKGLRVAAISVDPLPKKGAVARFASQNGLTFPILHDPKLVLSRSYGVTGFPETVFLDSSGRVLEFRNPESGMNAVRTIADQPWDSPSYIEAVTALLDAQRPVAAVVEKKEKK